MLLSGKWVGTERVWERRGQNLVALAKFSMLSFKLCPFSSQRSCNGGTQWERGPLSCPLVWIEQWDPEVISTHEAPRAYAKSFVGCGICRMRSQGTDGHGGSLLRSSSCGSLHQDSRWSQSLLQRGGGTTSWGLKSRQLLPYGHQEVQGVTKEAKTWEGILGPGPLGTFPKDSSSP